MTSDESRSVGLAGSIPFVIQEFVIRHFHCGPRLMSRSRLASERQRPARPCGPGHKDDGAGLPGPGAARVLRAAYYGPRLAHRRDGGPPAGKSVSAKRAKRAKRAKIKNFWSWNALKPENLSNSDEHLAGSMPFSVFIPSPQHSP